MKKRHDASCDETLNKLCSLETSKDRKVQTILVKL